MCDKKSERERERSEGWRDTVKRGPEQRQRMHACALSALRVMSHAPDTVIVTQHEGVSVTRRRFSVALARSDKGKRVDGLEGQANAN